MNHLDLLSHPAGVERLLEERQNDYTAQSSGGQSVYTEPDGCSRLAPCPWKDETTGTACLAPRTHRHPKAHVKTDEQGEAMCGHRTYRDRALGRPRGGHVPDASKLEDIALAQAALDISLKNLSYQQKMTLRLWYEEGRDAETIAERLHMSKWGVYKARTRGLRKIVEENR